jgi:nitrogen regulatory protein P-II 1
MSSLRWRDWRRRVDAWTGGFGAKDSGWRVTWGEGACCRVGKRDTRRRDLQFLPQSEALMTQNDVGEGGRAPANDQESVVHRDRVVQIIAMVKPFRAQAVLAALEGVEVLGGTVREAMGYGRQKDRLHRYLGSEYNASFVPKVELAVFVREADAAAAIKAIVGPARTGRIGDGKILVLRCYEEYLSW